MTPFASWSIWIVPAWIVPALRFPFSSKPVMVASANCPVGRSVIWKSMSSWVGDWRKFDQMLVAVLFRLLIV